MPRALPAKPRKMLPPPMTMANSQPRACTSLISAAIACSTSGSMPYPTFGINASPLSFSITLLYCKFASCRLAAGAVGGGAGLTVVSGRFLGHFSKLKACEAPHDDVLAELRDGIGHQLPNRALWLFDERLLE